MNRSKRVPRLARPTGRRRLIELGKDVLMVALTCSAILLAAQTPIAAHLWGRVAPSVPAEEPAQAQSRQAVAPYAIAVRSELGLYGACYDDALVGRAFDRFSPFFEEALASASEGRTVTDRQWRTMLGSPGVCLVFQGRPGAAVIAALLGGNDSLTGTVRELLLCWDGKQLWLAWHSGTAAWRAAASVQEPDRLEEALREFGPNGAAFAYTLSADDEAYRELEPYVLVTDSAPQPRVCTASSPDLTADSAALDSVLTSLGFLPGPNVAYETNQGLTVNENGDRLMVTPSGVVTFRAGEETRYPVARGRSGSTACDAVLASWELLSRVGQSWIGEGQYVLTGTEAAGGGWVVTFHACLEGVPVQMADDGWSARFVVEGDRISDFTISLRTYAAGQETTVLPTARLAAAALRSLPDSGGQLMLCYTDNRTANLTAGWVAGE